MAARIPGQSATLLPDGSVLLLGGMDAHGVSAATYIQQATTVTPLASRLHSARAWQSATILPDGTIAIIGGVGPSGKPVESIERFDSKAQTFSVVEANGITPRSHHTATLLTDGTVLIVGGLSADGKTLSSAEVWDPRTSKVTAVGTALGTARRDHTATLMSDGNVLIQGGVDSNRNKLDSRELYNPALQSFGPDPSARSETNSRRANVTLAPQLAGSIPAEGSSGVPVNTIISLRFSEPMQVATVNSDTLTLTGPEGIVAAPVVPAEGGMLAFINPESPLAPNSTYTITVDGAMARGGVEIAKTEISFTTGTGGVLVGSAGSAGASESSGEFNGAGVWIPTGDWRTHLPASPWQSLPPLQAPKGVTALSGQVLTIDGNPLANVTLQVGGRKVLSDGTGRFLIPGLQAGKAVLLIDATTANNNGRVFGIYQVSVEISAHVTNILPFTSWMPVLDMVHAATLPSPTINATVVSNPMMPGLELHIPAGTTITDINGKVVQTVSMTPVPLDRTPFPLPAGVNVPIYFTIQPGGAELWSGKSKWAWAQLYYPNPSHFGAGTRFDFWNYDPVGSGWYVYGQGSVDGDGSQVVPDPSVGIWTFSGAMVGSPSGPPKKGNCEGGGGGDPVDCSTGLFFHSETDLHLSDVIPIDFTRTYISQDSYSRPFGIGASDSYEMFLQGNSFPYTYMNLILSDGEQVNYTNTNPNGNDYANSHYVPALSSDASYYGSVITWNGAGWNLRLKNGTIYVFPDSYQTNSPAKAALVAIIDRYGNKLTITRDSNGNKTQITTPDGRWIQFQNDSNNRITQASDDLGRTLTYTYDTCATGYLCSVRDANGGTTTYSYYTSSNSPPAGYGGLGNLSKIVDQNGHSEITNLYDTNGRAVKQTLADGTSTFQMAYTLNSGLVSQASITDPNGNVEVKQFDSNGFVTSDTYANGVSGQQQTFTFTRDPNTELITSAVQPLPSPLTQRTTSYTHDSNGNMTQVTVIGGTQPTQQGYATATINMTYDPAFNQLTSVTDPLSHTWTIGYDSRGNATSITDPLSHQITLGYNFQGQLTSVTDALNATASFGYSYGDLATITDPLGNTIHRNSDGAGRLISLVDALSNLTQFSYDNRDRLLQITDANGKTTAFSYDAAGNLLSLTDARSNVTAYTYDNRNRVITRKDALLKSESYGYDGDSNLTSHTDRNGKVVAYTYDALNRRTFAGFGQTVKGHTTSYSAGTLTYTWDIGNRMTGAADSIAGTITRTYDGLNHVLSEQTPQGTVSYTYLSANGQTSGLRNTMTVAGQAAVGYNWDNANRLAGITQGSAGVGLSYDNANRRTCLTLPNGVIASYGYDNDSRVMSMNYGTGGSCASPPGNLGGLTYTYDADGRRTAAGGSLGAVTLPANVAGGTSTQYNADNAQSKFNGVSLSYDANGNLLSDGTNTYTWDARNHLTAIAGGTTSSFVDDGFGRRMSKTINGTLTQFLYDGLNPVQELNGTNGVVANLLTGLHIDEYFTRTASSTTSTFLADALGSTLGLVTANNGPIATSYTYQPFGATTIGGSANGNSYEFAGRENDGTGLYFYRARYYSPTYQRFIAQDPMGFRGGDTNLYGYVRNNPISFVDPAGLDVITLTGGVSLFAGGSDLNLPAGGVSASGGVAISFPTPWSPSSPFDIRLVDSKSKVQDYNGLKCGVDASVQWNPTLSNIQQLNGTDTTFQADVGFAGFDVSGSSVGPNGGVSAELGGLGYGDITTQTQVVPIPGISR